MRKLFSCLSFFALLFSSVASIRAQSPPAPAPPQAAPAAPSLQMFTSQEGRYSILFAGTPKQESQTLNLKSGGTSILYQASVELDNGNVAYMVMYNDYPGNYATGDAQTVLGNTRDGAVTGKTLLSDRVISLNGVPGRAFTASDKDWNYTVRQYLKGQRLYQLIVVSNAAHPATLADQVINSFQIW